MQNIQMILSEKQKTFFQFLCEFFKSTLIVEHLEKKMTLIADVFLKLRAPKNVLR